MKINEIDKTREELRNYIEENLAKGYSIENIKIVLIKSGLGRDFVNEIIKGYLIKEKSEVKKCKNAKEELEGYIRENIAKGYSIRAIKNVLINSGLEKSFVSRFVRGYYVRNVLAMPISVIMVVLLVSSLLVFRLMTVGLAPALLPEFLTIKESYSYIYPANLTLNESSDYIWFIGNYGSLKSIRLDGSISKEGSAKVYLEYEDKEYLIFDSSRLSKEVISEVTGLAVGDIINQSSLDNESEEIIDVVKEGEPLINNSLDNNLINKKIIITTQGGGRKDIEEIFEFNISSEFNWDVGYSKVCTKWDINDVSLCYGSSECCALINLESSGNWNSSFYLSYGRYGAGLSNTVRAQVIYANYSLDIEHPYADIVYSNINELEAEFYKAVIRFNDICIETCELPGFNATEYRLVFVIENATLKIDNIRYTIEKEINISRNAPVLVKEIENITIYKNEFTEINLSEYFYDEDGDKLNYTGYEVDNITLMIKDSIARIVPSYNFTGRRYMYFTASDGYYKVSSDIFLVNVIEKPLMVGEVNVSEELIKPRIVINQPVKWVKRVNASARVINLSVNISSDALNVTIKDIKEDRIISEDKIKINDEGVIKNASAYRAKKRIEQIKKIGDRLDRKKMKIIMERPTDKEGIANINKELLDLENERNRLTGYVVVVREKGLLTKFFEWLFNVKITGYVVAEPSENETLNVTSVIIEDIVEEVEIEYYTEAPVSEERNITNGKSILISSDVHYEDIEAYTYLNDVPQSSIRLYRIVNESRELVNNINYSDENNNSLIDRIGWIIPSLSNGTYEVIYIIKAVHLNESRDIISDIYGYVKELDGNWSEPIYSGEYVRVTFEIPLDNTRDITIYARASNLSNSTNITAVTAEIEVYKENNDTLITKFENISSENWYKVYLTNLNDSYDTFDLKILNSSVEFDYIVDPKIGPSGNISFVPPTPPNDTKTRNTSVGINISIIANMSEFKWNWNGTNYTFYNDSLVLMFNFDNISSLGENNTKVADMSGKGNNGTVYGDAVMNLTGGRYYGAFKFDGINDYVNVSNISRLSMFSIGFWFKPDKDYGLGTSNASLIYDDDYEIFIRNGPMIFNYTGNSISSSIDNWNKDRWYYVLATYDGYSQTLYIDGKYEASYIISGPFIVMNSTGNKVALFSESGDIILKGSCNAGGDCSYPVDDAFIVQNPSGATVAYINNTGDLCIEDADCNDKDANCDNPDDGSFIVKNSNDVIVSYINPGGNLCLIGGLVQNGNP